GEIGDNDSGRFVKLLPAYDQLTVGQAKARFLNLSQYDALPDDAVYWLERPLDHRHLVDALDDLYQPPNRTLSVDGALLRSMAKNCEFSAPCFNRVDGVAEDATWQQPRYPTPASFQALPDFGIFVYQFEHYQLTLRCGPVGQDGNGGHAHNDQLSFELAVEDKILVVDPGTYLYTPSCRRRNQFRSTSVHNTLVVPGREQ